MNSDKSIVARLMNKDKNALKILLSKHQDYIYTVLLHMLKDTRDAQEATQDTFVKVYKRINTYSGKSKFTTWLYSIAYRTGLDYLKKRKNVYSLNEETPLSNREVDHQTPYRLLEKKDRELQIQKLISLLNPEEASILKMYYFKELNSKEISEITGLSVSNVKVKLFRARKFLKESINSSLIQINTESI